MADHEEAAGMERMASVLKAVLTGAVVTLGAFVVVAGLAVLLLWSGGGAGRRATAMITAAGVLAAIAIGSWTGTRKSEPPGSLVAGLLVAVLVLGGAAIASWPFASPVLDIRSVAIALDWVEAPNVGTGPTETMHRLLDSHPSGTEDDSSGMLDTAATYVIEAIIVLVVFLVAAVLAGVLGAALHQREPPGKLGGAIRRQAWPSLVALIVGAGIPMAIAWPSVWASANAVIDFDQSAGPETGVSLSEVARHPQVMWGKRVTISAEVREVVGPHVALIGNAAPMVGDTVLIVSKPPLQQLVLLASVTDAELGPGDVVQVTGVVRQLDDALEENLGVSMDEEAIGNYGGPAVLAVDAIDLDVPAASEAGDKEFGFGSSGYDFGVTIDDVINDTKDHIGMTVTVSDEVEESLLTSHAFILGDQHLLVVSEETQPGVFVEATAYVTGEVRVFHLAEVEAQIGIDLDDAAMQRFEGRPFILMESVELVK